MQSRKTLFIILIIGLVIFIISLAIGRPLWQAALFGIGFLLITAIVTSRGLLIPEILSSRRFPGKPTEATGKEDFLKRMDSDLTEFSAQPVAKTEDIHWMTEYTRVMKGVGELVYDVHESVKSKDKAKQLRAFREVTKELPGLISQFKNIPELTIPKRRKTIEQQTRGLDLYLVACSNFAEALEMSDGDLAGLAAKQITEALDLLDIMGKSSTASGWG